jgi:hypothetical protein
LSEVVRIFKYGISENYFPLTDEGGKCCKESNLSGVNMDWCDRNRSWRLRSCPDFTHNERNSFSFRDMLFEKLQNFCAVKNNSDICCNTQSLEKIELGDEQEQTKNCLTLFIPMCYLNSQGIRIIQSNTPDPYSIFVQFGSQWYKKSDLDLFFGRALMMAVWS